MENIIKTNDSKSENDFEEDRLGKIIVDSAFFVHRELGPGLLENTYEACLEEELKYRGLNVLSQFALPVHFRNVKLDIGYRIDLLVEDKIIIELKACERFLPVHEAQLLTYMKLYDRRLGYLFNFNSALIKDGMKRMVRRK